MIFLTKKKEEKHTLDTSAACEYKQKAGQVHVIDGIPRRVTEKTFCLVRWTNWGQRDKIHHNRLSVNNDSLECSKRSKMHMLDLHTHTTRTTTKLNFRGCPITLSTSLHEQHAHFLPNHALHPFYVY